MKKQYFSPVAVAVTTDYEDLLTLSSQFSVNYGEGEADEVIFSRLK